MVLEYIVGFGPTQVDALDDMYSEAGKLGATGNPEVMNYVCLLKLPEGTVTSEANTDYNAALQAALDEAKITDYDPNSLIVGVKAEFDVPQLAPKPQPEASGAAPGRIGCRDLTDSLF